MPFRTWDGYRYGAAPLRVAHGVIESIESTPQGTGVEAGRVPESGPSPGRKARRIDVRLDGGGALAVDDVAAARLHARG